MRSRRLSHIIALTAIVILSTAPDSRAQTPATDELRPAPFFAGGSILLSSRHREIKDPADGYAYLHTLFDGSIEWPAIGAIFNAGALVAPSWSVGGEIMLRSPQTATVAEKFQWKFEMTRLSSTYTDRERLYSAVVRRHVVRRAVDLQPVMGFTLSHSTQTLTNRRGEYLWGAGRSPIEEKDVSVSTTRPGVVGGADLLFRTSSRLAVSVGTRLHWIRRVKYDEYEREVPHAGPLVLSFGAGLSWQQRRTPRTNR